MNSTIARSGLLALLAFASPCAAQMSASDVEAIMSNTRTGGVF